MDGLGWRSPSGDDLLAYSLPIDSADYSEKAPPPLALALSGMDEKTLLWKRMEEKLEGRMEVEEQLGKRV